MINRNPQKKPPREDNCDKHGTGQRRNQRIKGLVLCFKYNIFLFVMSYGSVRIICVVQFYSNNDRTASGNCDRSDNEHRRKTSERNRETLNSESSCTTHAHAKTTQATYTKHALILILELPELLWDVTQICQQHDPEVRDAKKLRGKDFFPSL